MGAVGKRYVEQSGELAETDAESVADDGSEHVNADDPDPARQLIADWFADRLGTVPARG